MRKTVFSALLILALLMAIAAPGLAELGGVVLTINAGGDQAADPVEEETSVPEEVPPSVVKLPIDFSPGYAPVEEGFDGLHSYHDPSIDVEITEYTWPSKEFQTYVWVASIQIRDASQLRTAPAESFKWVTVLNGVKIAKRMNAVLAIDGDYFGFHDRGFVIRQGQEYRDKYCVRDVLLIDEDGDFHVIRGPSSGGFGTTVDGKAIVNAFYFGPILVENGELTDRYDYIEFDSEELYPRVAICQAGPLSYKVIVASGFGGKYKGIRLRDFAAICQHEGVSIAYNMDGGLSTMLYFHGEKLNEPLNDNYRDLYDILYFASAWTGEE